MELRKTAVYFEEVNAEYGAPVRPPLRRVAIGAVFKNPLLGQPASASLQPLIDLSCELGEPLTKHALSILGDGQLRSYTKGAIVGTAGAVEHGAALIHPRFGMAMRKAIRRGRVIIPGHAKIGRADKSLLASGRLPQGQQDRLQHRRHGTERMLAGGQEQGVECYGGALAHLYVAKARLRVKKRVLLQRHRVNSRCHAGD